MAITPIVTNAASPETTEPSGSGGELIDLGTFALDGPEHLDPALNSTLDAYQVINALYDGLTDVDFSDPENPEVKPHLAESFEANEEGTVWTFTIREGLAFSDGEAILPSTFQRSWERATSEEILANSSYAYLFSFIEGGQEKIDGEADTISGVVADDEAMTLTVTLSAPYGNFPAVAGFQLFFPVPEAAEENAVDYENTLMIGNGPYAMEAARTDEEIVLVRNDEWAGDVNGETWPDRPERLVFRVSADADTSYNSLEAGEGDTARIPAGRTAEAVENWGTTTDIPILGVYYFMFDQRDEIIGGPENVLLRQAVSQAIDREAINDAVFDGARVPATGITPEGIPGYVPDICDFCTYDPVAAQAAFDEWTAAGNSMAEPLPIQYGAGGVHGDVVQLIIDNLATIGIEAVPEELDTETYFTQMRDGACVFCRTGWIADYPTYDNFTFDLFHSPFGGNNYGYESEAFDALVDEAKATVDPEAAADLYHQAEEMLLNTDVMAVPILFYRGDYAFDEERLQGFTQTPGLLIPWEQITIVE